MSSTNSDRDTNRLNYSSASRKVKQLLRKKKRAFEKEIASKSKTHPKLFWSHTRSKLKTKTGVAPLLLDVKDKKSLKFDDIEKANILQSQFTSVFVKEPGGEIPKTTIKSR